MLEQRKEGNKKIFSDGPLREIYQRLRLRGLSDNNNVFDGGDNLDQKIFLDVPKIILYSEITIYFAMQSQIILYLEIIIILHIIIIIILYLEMVIISLILITQLYLDIIIMLKVIVY